MRFCFLNEVQPNTDTSYKFNNTQRNQTLAEVSELVSQLTALLQWEDVKVLTKAAAVVAALAKTDSGRTACCCLRIASPLLKLLASHSDTQLWIQVCRALANICYENCESSLIYDIMWFILYSNNTSKRV